MMISEMIKSFDKLSAQEQDNLLEILRQRRSQLTEGENLANHSESKEAISKCYNSIALTTAKVETVDDLKVNLDTEKQGFWSVLQDFRSRVDLESLDDDTFDNLRDKSPGRDVIL